MAKLVSFYLPDGEYEQLSKRSRGRGPDAWAKVIVRASLYRDRRHEERVKFRQQQREAAGVGTSG